LLNLLDYAAKSAALREYAPEYAKELHKSLHTTHELSRNIGSALFAQAREPLFRQFWILSLFSGVEEAGCSPIDLKRFNVLAYLSNAVAQCYGVPPLDATVLKERDGPLYPILIWDIDRLVGMGLVHVTNCH